MSSTKLRIVSGGQTGIDRIALDAAIETGLEHGGWCPKGRIAEDGKIPAKYLLAETGTKNYAVRTERNIEDSDGTLILYFGKMSGGTALTLRLAAKHRKPCVQLDFERIDPDEFQHEILNVRQWLQSNEIQTLNIAGPRKSSSPDLPAYVYPFLIRLFRSD